MRGIARVLALTLPLTAVPALAVGVSAQSVEDIVEQMYAAYEQQADGVDNYTLSQTVMGFSSETYFEKQMIDGRPVFMPQGGSDDMSAFSFGLGSGDDGNGNVYQVGPELIEHARYAGREAIDGNDVHVLAIDDLSQVQLPQQSTPGEMEFEPKTGTMYIDTELMVPRRMSFVGDATTPNGVHEVTVQIDMLDIRDVEGLLIPFRTVMEISGLQAMIDPETQAQLRQMEEQLAALPPEQREMMERMMGDQLEQLRRMAAGDGDSMSVQVEVDEVRVNEGPPSQ